MITLETTIDILAPIDVVWSILIDFPQYEIWNPYIVKIEGEAVAGAVIRVHSLPKADADIQKAPVQVVALEPYSMRWEGGLPDRDKFKGDHWFVLEACDGGTCLQHFEHFSGELAQTILNRHGALIRENFNIFNKAVKAQAECAQHKSRAQGGDVT
jgi:hypothetical protein